MQMLGSIVAGLTVLAISFGLGSYRVGEPSHPAASAPPGTQAESITYPGRDEPTKEGTRTDHLHFGLIPYTTYAEAQPRLEELLTAYRRLGSYARYSMPVRGEKILDEIEGILSLAKEEHLLAFLRESRVDDDDHSISQIAYGALARLSPARAAEIWAGQAADSESSDGELLGLMRVWEQRDSAGAERWVESLQDDATRAKAKLALLTMKASSDPARALESLDEIDPEKGHGIALLLGETLDLAQMPEAAAELLAKKEPGTNSGTMLSTLLAAWGEREPDAMMAWLFTRDLESIGSQALQQSLQGIAVKDPAGLLAKLAPELATKPGLNDAAGQAWWIWLTSEKGQPDAMAWLGEHPDLAPGMVQFNRSYAYLNNDDWTPQRTEGILESLKSLPESTTKSAFSQELLGMLSQSHPKAVLDYAMEFLPLGSQTDSTIAWAIGRWSRSGEPEAAIEWSLENLESPNARSSALRFAISNWADKDGPAAAAYAMTLSDKDRGSALYGLTYSWTEKDPDAVLAFAKSAPDPAVVSSLTQGAFRHLAEQKSGAKHFPAALQMPAGKMRHDAVRGLFGGWALSDPTAAVASLDTVPSGTLRDAAIQGFNSFAARRDPQLAWELSARISTAATRDKELTFRGRDWMKQDAKVAEAAIRGNANIPETVKAEIFK